MKKISFFIFFTLVIIQINYAQVGIGISTPHASSLLDITSTSKGLLIPRMTTLQRTGITSPATGLQVFDTDTKTFWFYNSIGWIEFSTGSPTNFWTANGNNIFNNNSGNVGIGINTPLAPLHIKNDNEALRLQGTTPYISFRDNAGNQKAFLQNFNSDLYLGTPSSNTTGKIQVYASNNPVVTILPSGNVGIGTVTPANKFTVQTLTKDFGFTHTDGTVIVGSYVGDFGIDGTGGWFGTKTNHPLNFFTNNSLAQMTILPSGRVGIGTTTPVNKFQIGSVGNASPFFYSGNDFAIGNGTSAMRISQESSAAIIASNNTNIALLPKESSGNVGINTSSPTNKLQIGSMGNTGFATNDLAIGNGIHAMAIQQTNASTVIGSTTDIVLKPRNNGHGRVGINTNTPRAPLDVVDFADVPDVNGASNVDYAYFALRYVNFQPDAFTGGTTQPLYAQVSIFAGGRIVASEFDANSDARIKNIIGVSDGGNDLNIINSIKVTDYSMKDRVKFGDRQYKKVIAQEVEKVYPRVISKHTDFIPNVYQPSSKLTKTTNGYLISFNTPHNISNNAKKLQVLVDGSGMQPFEIASIPSANEVIIKATDIKADKVFAYGEEVDDFRTVDYEGLTTLNISATQELSKLVKKQQVLIELLEKRVAALETKK